MRKNNKISINSLPSTKLHKQNPENLKLQGTQVEHILQNGKNTRENIIHFQGVGR